MVAKTELKRNIHSARLWAENPADLRGCWRIFVLGLNCWHVNFHAFKHTLIYCVVVICSASLAQSELEFIDWGYPIWPSKRKGVVPRCSGNRHPRIVVLGFWFLPCSNDYLTEYWVSERTNTSELVDCRFPLGTFRCLGLYQLYRFHMWPLEAQDHISDHNSAGWNKPGSITSKRWTLLYRGMI